MNSPTMTSEFEPATLPPHAPRPSPIMDVEAFSSNQFLENLPEETEPIIATNKQAIRRALKKKLDTDEEESEFILFSYVGPQLFGQLSNDGGSRGEIGIRTFYDASSLNLIVKIPRRAHEAATRALEFLIVQEASRQGLDDQLLAVGSETIKEDPYSKEGDAAFIPQGPIPGRDDKWPTLVIETGLSESLLRLRVDASWWLTMSSGLVKMVIIISIDRAQPKILLECWKLGAVQHSHQLRSLCWNPLRPTKTHSITMTHNGTSTTIAGAPLVIPFDDVFAIPPSGPTQGDFVFGSAVLEGFARKVWRGQKLI
ncbi:hypothetical protein BDV25DRAFT_94203 [Aspergillus avenaceus]|uniref:Uncharacterized protein n=1 Tax=Aspergillus avenaceus TaxID=36643 RepID=A0A5N6U7W2_ASPAV|nr:hypothetical protein BDV25DRAFT_94203 [Aspergillus avenaceus]